MKNKFICSLLTACAASIPLFAQEALKSVEEDYYDFLSLNGLVERPTLNYRTLSDNEWTLNEEASQDAGNLWQNNNLGSKITIFTPSQKTDNLFTRGIEQEVKLKIYGPDWYNSYNTEAPFGQNDGALWQGKGYNTSLTAGARLEGYGLELTFKPQLSWSQNAKFDYIKPNYSGELYSEKADTYGYYGVPSIDAPQRFGDDSFFTYDWGDTEIRYTWHNITVGLGTQTIWLGPAELNPIIHSNNAPSYPKFDVGLRKTPITIPKLNWYLGDIEARGWWGQLKESDYFDLDESNNKNLITGLTVAWATPFFRGLTIGINRTMLTQWNNIDKYALFEIYMPFNNNGGSDVSDQRFSFTLDYLFSPVGLDLYLEWARNDFSPDIDSILRYPFHTQAWTLGGKKTFKINDKLKGCINIEVTELESSRDYEGLWATTFYAHHLITQGYTSKGQWIGAGIGTGGNSQYLGIKLYTPKTCINAFIQRRNPDMDYTWFYDINNNDKWEHSIRTILTEGIGCDYFLTNNFNINGNLIFSHEWQPTNESIHNTYPRGRNNFSFSFGAKYNF